MDIEGEEYNVILKNNSWILKCSMILFENHLNYKKSKKLIKVLEKKGFKEIDKFENVYLFRKEKN